MNAVYVAQALQLPKEKLAVHAEICKRFCRRDGTGACDPNRVFCCLARRVFTYRFAHRPESPKTVDGFRRYATGEPEVGEIVT